jgi:hypothetical protein
MLTASFSRSHSEELVYFLLFRLVNYCSPFQRRHLELLLCRRNRVCCYNEPTLSEMRMSTNPLVLITFVTRLQFGNNLPCIEDSNFRLLRRTCAVAGVGYRCSTASALTEWYRIVRV